MAISEKNTRIQITIQKDLYEKVKKIAEAENRSVSNYVVSLIKKAVEN